MMALARRAWSALALLAACGLPVAAATGAPPPGDIEVLVDVPPSNFVYRVGHQIVHGGAAPTGGGGGIPPVSSPGVGVGAALALNLLANVVISAVEAGQVAELQKAAGPVGASLQDVDLHATTLEQLRRLLPPQGPRWHFSTDAFPQPLPVSTEETRDPVSGRFRRPMAPPPNQHLIDRARGTAHGAVLYIRVLPLYQGLQDRMYVNVAALLIDRSGAPRGEWVTQVMAPGAPRLEGAELVRWWAEDRYRRFVLQGLRGALLPLVEELSDPALRAQRQKAHATMSAVHFDDAGRPADRMIGHAVNVQRKASGDCVLQAEPGELVYHFERTRQAQQIVGAAFCASDPPTGWNTDPVPGLAWTQAVRSAPVVVLKRR